MSTFDRALQPQVHWEVVVVVVDGVRLVVAEVKGWVLVITRRRFDRTFTLAFLPFVRKLMYA